MRRAVLFFVLFLAALVFVSSCASSRSLTIQEQLELKRQIIEENPDLTAQEREIIIHSQFQTEGEARALVQRLKELREKREGGLGPGQVRTAREILSGEDGDRE
jgi:hypothetical protein